MLKQYRRRENRPCRQALRSTPKRLSKRLLMITFLVLVFAGWNNNRLDEGMDPPTWFGRVQVIHNAPDAGKIDLYVDGRRVWNDAAFQTATPYLPLAHGRHTIEIVAGADLNNSSPIHAQTVTVLRGVNYVVVANGLVNPGPGEPAFQLVVEEGARLESTSVKHVDFFLVHGASCLGEVDMRVLDPVRNNEVIALLVNNIGFGEVSVYRSLEAGAGHNLEIVTADSSKQLAAFRLALPVPSGQTFVSVLSCSDTKGVEGLTMLGVEVDGSVFLPPIITANEPLAGAGVPETFKVYGNYPNPFNPSTTIQFDLVQPAAVSVEIVDMLGRLVMTLPAQQMEAGAARTVEVEAVSLASGAYLYRLIARTAGEMRVETGWMMVVR